MSRRKQDPLVPKSPPPAAAPPPVPLGSEAQSLLGMPGSYGSYQQDEQVPQLRDQLQGHVGHNPVTPNSYNDRNKLQSSYGDATLTPNTGEDNWVEDEILGLALHEILKGVQWSNILACVLVIVLEVLVAIYRFVTLAASRLVLGAYLAFFASLILRVEIASIVKQHKERLSIGNVSAEESRELLGGIGGGFNRAPNVEAPALRDSFGLVFHPSGRACMLLLMSTMCFGQSNNIPELALGGWLGLNGMITLYLVFRYPAYRREEDIPVPKLPPIPEQSTPKRTAASWSYYENEASSLWKVSSTIAESASMLTAPSLRDQPTYNLSY